MPSANAFARNQSDAAEMAKHRACFEAELAVARKEAAQAHDYLQLAEKLAGVGHWRVEIATGHSYWSPELYRINGLDPASYSPRLGDGMIRFVEEDRFAVNAMIANCLATGAAFTYRARILQHGTDDIRHIEASGVGERNGRGNVTGMFGVFRDVTDMARAQEQIADSEASYRLLADTANDIIAVFSLDGTVEYISPAIGKILGYTVAEMQGENISRVIHSEDFEATMEAYAQYVESEDWIQSPIIQYRAHHRSGKVVWLEARPQALIDRATGKVASFHNTIRDITLQKATEQALAEKTREAEAAAEAKAQFLATMSHELRTPLTSIIGYSSLLRDLLTEADGNRRHAQRIHTAGQGLLALINDILDHSKLEAGQLELEIEPTDLVCLTRDIRDLMQVQSEAKGLELRVTGIETVPALVLADEMRLRQILLNLVSNAVKFTPEGSVGVSLNWRDDILRVAVTDCGPGISVDGQAQLFQRFSQVDKASNRAGGTGLGLLISKQLTELMGGQIGVDSVEGRGATFWFIIPATEAALADRGPSRGVTA